MNSTPGVPSSDPLGEQRPRLWSAPPSSWSEGERVKGIAATAGLYLDDWQSWLLDQALGRDDQGKWTAFEACLICSRQNGKGSVLEALELAALFLDDFGAELILHSAHEFKTAAEAFLRIRALISENPVFERRIARIRTGAGSEAIELKNGKRLRFIARSSGSGRGFSADLVILDEAFNLGDDAMAALLPTLSTRPNPQIWYTSTAGIETSVQLGRVRERGLTGTDPSLAFFEWSVDREAYDPASVADWARANPGMGIRISPDYIARERAALAPDAFARERLGIGLYPTDLANAWQVVSRDAWMPLADLGSSAKDPVSFGIEVAHVAPFREVTAIGASGRNLDGRRHVEVIEHRPGTDWVVARTAELYRKHRALPVVVDPGSYAGALIEDLVKAGVEIAAPFSARDAAQACGQFRNLVTAGDLAHLDQPELNKALAGAATRPLSDGEAWDRRSVRVDTSPLVAVSNASWGYSKYGRPEEPPYNMLRSVG